MQLVSSRIWTRVTVTVSYNDNHYTTGTSFLHVLIIDFFQKHCQVLFIEKIVSVQFIRNFPVFTLEKVDDIVYFWPFFFEWH